jgi:hypothetical protein
MTLHADLSMRCRATLTHTLPFCGTTVKLGEDALAVARFVQRDLPSYFSFRGRGGGGPRGIAEIAFCSRDGQTL